MLYLLAPELGPLTPLHFLPCLATCLYRYQVSRLQISSISSSSSPYSSSITSSSPSSPVSSISPPAVCPLAASPSSARVVTSGGVSGTFGGVSGTISSSSSLLTFFGFGKGLLWRLGRRADRRGYDVADSVVGLRDGPGFATPTPESQHVLRRVMRWLRTYPTASSLSLSLPQTSLP